MLTTRIKYHEKIKAEIEREWMRGNLLRAVSHDLRTPLTSIYGASSAVVENYDELDQEHKIELMKGVQEVIVSIPEEFIVIPMDAMLIEQVLVNLLENAVDHAVGMEELRLEVSCSNGYAHFVVRDDGCGILPERMEQLFRATWVGRIDRQTGAAAIWASVFPSVLLL